MFGEFEAVNIVSIDTRETQPGRECVRLGNGFNQFEKGATISEAKGLPRAVGALGFERGGPATKHLGKRQFVLAAQPETRRYAVLEDFQKDNAVAGINAAVFVMPMWFMPMWFGSMCFMPVPMRMAMMIAATAEQPGGDGVHGKSGGGDRDRLAEMDRYRREETRHRLIADEQGDHR